MIFSSINFFTKGLFVALSVIAMFVFSACEEPCHLGVGKLVSENIDLSPLHSIDLKFDADLRIKQADLQSVEITQFKQG